VDPGWYPDPFSPNLLRWWDGQTWTAQTAPMHSTLPSGWAPVDPRPDIARANVAARQAAIAVVFGAAVYIAQYFITALVIGDAFHKLIREVRDDVRAANNGATVHPHVGVPFYWQLYLVWLPALVVQIFLMIWLFRVATVARRAGWPARRQPVWAFAGFLIPIVSLWFPYQVAHDAFPPGDPARSTAGRWWAWYLAQGLLGIPLTIVSIISTSIGVGVAAIGSLVPVLAAVEGRALIAAIDASQERGLIGGP
jgi:hypothetical protein